MWKSIWDLIKDMLSESNTSSCMRFCVVIVVVTMMVNYTFLNVYSMIDTGKFVSMSIKDVISLLSVLGLKLGQKKMEATKE